MTTSSSARVLSRANGTTPSLDELVRLRAAIATLVIEDAAYAPIFDRLESEIDALKASDPVARARAVVALQKAMA